MLTPALSHQTAETIRLAAVKRTENRSTKYRIAGMEDADILNLAPEPGILAALETIELPRESQSGTADDWIMWEAANRAWHHALPPAAITKWAIAIVRHVDEGLRAEERQRNQRKATATAD